MSSLIPATQKISLSKQRFENIVWPEIKNWFNGGKLVAGEAVNENIADLLDQEAGVDFYCVIADEGVVTIASRVQKQKCWETHTVRYTTNSGYDTEIDKRLRQISNGLLYPMITIQSYVELSDKFNKRCVNGELRNCAGVKSKPIYDYIDFTEEVEAPNSVDDMPANGWYTRTNGEDGNTFAVIPWSVLDKITNLRVRYRDKTDLSATHNHDGSWINTVMTNSKPSPNVSPTPETDKPQSNITRWA